MGCTMLEKRHAEVVESGIELQVIGRELEPHDIAEAQELAQVRGLLVEALSTRQAHPVRVALEWVERLIERDSRENREYHAPITMIGKTVARYHDAVGLKRLIASAANTDDAA